MLDNPTWWGRFWCNRGSHKWSVWGTPEESEWETLLAGVRTGNKVIVAVQQRQCLRCGRVQRLVTPHSSAIEAKVIG